MTKRNAMATCSNLLCLVILAGALVAAAHGEVETTTTTTTNIRLPSDRKTAKPWDCCDNLEMSPVEVFPPLYRCNDEVKQCAANCKECVEAPGDFPRALICRDWYQTEDPGPSCTGPNKKRPWKCCDDLKKSPLRIFPPLWNCSDVVGECNANCKDCVPAPEGGYVCRDWYWGEKPGPICKARPWGKCCDSTACTKSIPPICQCGDEVKKCAASCKECERVKSADPPRFVCRDQYTGSPGRKCTP